MELQNPKYIENASDERMERRWWVPDHRLFWFCFLVSLVVLAICSKSSFLYPFNDWVDANCYFTVGKGMMQGMVVYRDLLEQKGILLYFIHGLAYLISHTSFIGVYISEVIAGAFFLFFAAKTIRLFLPAKTAYLLIPVLAALTYASLYFSHGDSAEEFCLPFLMAGLYYFLSFFQGKELSKTIFVVNGILCGCVLWIKYTMIGFYPVWLLAIALGMLRKKQGSHALIACFCFLSGLIISTIPWFLYFAINNALSDWFTTYFTMNLTLYAQIPSSPSALLYTVAKNFLAALYKSPLAVIALGTGGVGFVCTNRFLRGFLPKISLALLFSALALSVYGGGKKYPYYFLIFYVFMVLSLLVLAKGTIFLAGRFKEPKQSGQLSGWFRRWVFAISAASIFALSALFAYLGSPNVDFMEQAQSELAQFRFARIILQSDDPTLLNYGFLDGGFYTAADILPQTKYFCKLNTSDSTITQAQNEIIKNKETNFVVLRLRSRKKQFDTGNGIPYLLENYTLVDSIQQDFDNIHFTYVLYQAK